MPGVPLESLWMLSFDLIVDNKNQTKKRLKKKKKNCSGKDGKYDKKLLRPCSPWMLP